MSRIQFWHVSKRNVLSVNKISSGGKEHLYVLFNDFLFNQTPRYIYISNNSISYILEKKTDIRQG